MISGIVVTSRPEDQAEVRREIEALDYADVHYCDPRGRLVVTLEAPGIDASMERVETIGQISRVLGVSLAQYCSEGDEIKNPPKPRRDTGSRAINSKRAPRDRRQA